MPGDVIQVYYRWTKIKPQPSPTKKTCEPQTPAISMWSNRATELLATGFCFFCPRRASSSTEKRVEIWICVGGYVEICWMVRVWFGWSKVVVWVWVGPNEPPRLISVWYTLLLWHDYLFWFLVGTVPIQGIITFEAPRNEDHDRYPEPNIFLLSWHRMVWHHLRHLN